MHLIILCKYLVPIKRSKKSFHDPNKPISFRIIDPKKPFPIVPYFAGYGVPRSCFVYYSLSPSYHFLRDIVYGVLIPVPCTALFRVPCNSMVELSQIVDFMQTFPCAKQDDDKTIT